MEGTGAANSNGTRTNSATPTIWSARFHRPHPFFEGIKLFIPPLQGLLDVLQRGPSVANELSNVFRLAVAVQSEILLSRSPYIPEVPAPLMAEGKPFTLRTVQKAYPKEQPPKPEPRHANEILPHPLYKPRQRKWSQFNLFAAN
jgi:hypothetical protein